MISTEWWQKRTQSISISACRKAVTRGALATQQPHMKCVIKTLFYRFSNKWLISQKALVFRAIGQQPQSTTATEIEAAIEARSRSSLHRKTKAFCSPNLIEEISIESIPVFVHPLSRDWRGIVLRHSFGGFPLKFAPQKPQIWDCLGLSGFNKWDLFLS